MDSHLKNSKKWYLLGGILATIIFLVIVNLTLNGYYLQLVNLLGINIILVVSLSVTNGYTGIFSMGHAAFMAIGAYTTAILSYPLERRQLMFTEMPEWLLKMYVPFPIAILIGGLLAVILAILIGYPILKLKGHYLAVATLGLMNIISVVATNAREITKGKTGISGLPNHSNSWWIYIVAAITIYVVWRLLTSAYGRAMLAIREDDLAAQAVGINIHKTKILSLCVGAFFAAVGGALYGHLILSINPNMFSYAMTFNLIVMWVIGGKSTILGSILGAILVTLIPELFLKKLEQGLVIGSFEIPQLYGASQIIMAIALICILIWKPNGLLGDKLGR